MKTNVLEIFLTLLKVKHTKKYTHQYFNEHPNKYNLLGLSSMLTQYGIENVGLRITNKEDILNLECPFIAHVGNDFAVIEKVSDNKIVYTLNDNRISIPLSAFYKIWTGYVLLAEVNESSVEPNYLLHRREAVFSKIQKILPVIFSIFILFYFVVSSKSYLNIGIVLLFSINIVGIIIGYLLILKQLKIQNDYADKLCSLFGYSDCNNILESEASKFLGFLSWSEVGFGYFISNVVVLSFLPNLANYLAISNIVTLPFSFWSLWYQKYKAGLWCILCLSVLFLLWSIFAINVFFGNFYFSQFNFLNLLIIGGIHIIIILELNLFLAIVANSNKASILKYEINSIKADEDVFKTLLTKQPHYEVSKSTSQILFGNKYSKNLITVFSNPHCNPCAKMHGRISGLIKNNKNVCVQYILASSKDKEVSNEFLIGVYQQRNQQVMQIYNDWFTYGKYDKERFFDNYPIEMGKKDIENEYTKHKQWKEKSGLRETPTILVNGYKLPNNFKIEDLLYFTDIEI